MSLAARVRVARRFQRAIRVDLDLSDLAALEGFVCPRSSAVVLQTMARHIAETGQAAFTWTGPYGTGKSSLAVAFSAALNGQPQLRAAAVTALGPETAAVVWRALPPQAKGWRILPVVGSRGRPAQAVGKALAAARLVRTGPDGGWSDAAVFSTLTRIAKRTPRVNGGLLVLIDEMGKFLEGAAYDGTDIYFFQQLAELAARSNRRLIVIGILHQAFEEYAHRLSREMRDEWAKIQGRFVDLAVSTGADEQLGLLGRAIEIDHVPSKPGTLATAVAAWTRRPQTAPLLEACWPLHPIVAGLLGPISRRRFGQNQRSLFGFLNSTEPLGFQDFLRAAQDGDLYPPEQLWDYLRANLEPSIMASPDSHRWALAVAAVERCQATMADDLRLRLLKIIGLVDLFKEHAGLVASLPLLGAALPAHSRAEIEDALADLQAASLVIYRKFNDGYSLFEGSDFDIEQAVEAAYGTLGALDFTRLAALAGLQPIIAKRHYHETGALRWFDTVVVPLSEVVETAANYAPRNGATGAFLLALPTPGDSKEAVTRMARAAANSAAAAYDTVIGIPQRTTWTVTTLARELWALEEVRDSTPELQGDRVARIEVAGRIAALREDIEREISRAVESARWYRRGAEPLALDQAELNSLASDLADARYAQAPRLHNELLNRIKPSSNAVAAQNVLLRHMALNEGQARLGIAGFPAEGGLFASLLEATGLYAETAEGWRFVSPGSTGSDPCNLAPAWQAAAGLLAANAHRTVAVAELYDLWREPPFGIKDGLLPILVVAFILSNRHTLAFYRQGIFQARLTDLDTDYLAKDPRDIQLRWMDLSEVARQLLSDLAEVVRELDAENRLTNLEPIDVARGLVAIYDRLPPWVGRTQRLSANAKRIRQLFKQAQDPNRLLFDDIPQTLTAGADGGAGESLQRTVDGVRAGLAELQQAYPAMLHRLREMLLAELQVPNASLPMLAELRARAENIREVSGDHRLEAFVLRLAQFQGHDADMESLGSMATNKPARGWVDADIDRAAVELAALAQQFVRTETFARVKGRPDKRHALAVVVGVAGRPTPLYHEFAVSDQERSAAEAMIAQFQAAVADSGEARPNVILAALAAVSARYLDGPATAERGDGSGETGEYREHD